VESVFIFNNKIVIINTQNQDTPLEI